MLLNRLCVRMSFVFRLLSVVSCRFVLVVELIRLCVMVRWVMLFFSVVCGLFFG